MKRLITIALCAGLLFGLLTACGSSPSGSVAQGTSSTVDTPTNSTGNDDVLDTAAGSTGAPWDRNITVNGASIEIGCTLGEFRDATGFELVERLNSPSQLIFSDGHSTILVYITPGWAEDETDYSSLFIGLDTTASTHDAALSGFDTSNSSVVLAGGITIGSTLDEMLAAYGEPDFTYDNTLEDGTETEVYNYPAPDGETGYVTIEVETGTNLINRLDTYHAGLLEE